MGQDKAKRRIVGLDALRLVAITMVVIYHCFPGVLPGGFVAVEMFFVLSGFLMGQKLLREYRKSGEIDSGKRKWQVSWKKAVATLWWLSWGCCVCTSEWLSHCF